MAKRRVKKEVPLTRKQISRRDKERRQRLTLLGIAIAIGCLIGGILIFGAYQELVAKPVAPVARVNGIPISTQLYQKRVLLQRMNYDSAIQSLQAQRLMYDSETGAFMQSLIDQQITQFSWQRQLLDDETFVDQLIDEELIRQAAQREGITVSPEEIERRIEADFGYSGEEPTPAPSPTTGVITSTSEITPTEAPTPMTRAAFEELYSSVLSDWQERTDISEAEYREIIAAELYRTKMQEFVGQQVPTSEPQVRARHILVGTEEEAQAVLERLQDGEDFALVATEVSTDTVSAEMGGELGWFARGIMDPTFEEAAFSLAVGEISDIVETGYGFHIIQVEERDENRELDDATLDQRKSDAFQVWLVDLQAEAEIEKYWSPDKVPPER